MSTLDAELPRAPHVEGPSPHLLIIRAPYYRDVVDGLTAGAYRILGEAGATADTLDVAGAYELPQVLRIALRGSRRFDGFIALGCVIRGETSHYDIVCNECARGVQNLAIEHGLAVGFGVLTVEDEEQAWVRAKKSEMDKGGETARACLAMIALRRELGHH